MICPSKDTAEDTVKKDPSPASPPSESESAERPAKAATEISFSTDPSEASIDPEPLIAPKLIPQAELDAEYKRTQEEFDKYIAEYIFPEDLSKSAKKKLIKKLHFEYFKKIRRKIEREKIKRKRAERGDDAPSKRRKVTKLSDSDNKLRIALDCSYDDLMTERDIVKLSKQIQRCYTLNRHMEDPLQLHLTHLQGKSLSRMEGFIDGYRNWDVHIKSESLLELFPPSEVVYLCAESENTLSEFDDSKVYVIGGFVDHNSHKGLAYERALAAGYGHARLPIDSYFTLATRKVLTVCHVFEIIKNFVESRSWEEAIRLTIPARKGLEDKV